MAKTIKQIADEIGVSKQAVFKKIDNLGCRQQLTKIENQFTVDESLENAIKKAFSNKNDKSNTVNQSSTDYQQFMFYLTESLQVLKQQNELLSKQLKEKDIQLAEKDKQIEVAQKLADQAQQLQAMTENKIKLLEQHNQHLSEQVVSRSNSEDHPEVKKGFFARLFRGRL